MAVPLLFYIRSPRAAFFSHDGRTDGAAVGFLSDVPPTTSINGDPDPLLLANTLCGEIATTMSRRSARICMMYIMLSSMTTAYMYVYVFFPSREGIHAWLLLFLFRFLCSPWL